MLLVLACIWRASCRRGRARGAPGKSRSSAPVDTTRGIDTARALFTSSCSMPSPCTSLDFEIYVAGDLHAITRESASRR
eukprot:6772302-Pyramimonas_sp.AAC.1